MGPDGEIEDEAQVSRQCTLCGRRASPLRFSIDKSSFCRRHATGREEKSRSAIRGYSNGFTVTVLQPGRYRLIRSGQTLVANSENICKSADLVNTIERVRTQGWRLEIMVSPVRIRVPPLTKVLQMRYTGSGSVSAETVTPPDSTATSIYIT